MTIPFSPLPLRRIELPAPDDAALVLPAACRGWLLDYGPALDRWLYAGIGSPKFIELKSLYALPVAGQRTPRPESFGEQQVPFQGGYFIQIDYPSFATSALHPLVVDWENARAALYDTILCYSFSRRAWFVGGNTGPLIDSDKSSFTSAAISCNFNNSRKSLSTPILSNSRAAYIEKVQQAKRYISNGDIYQLNLATCFSAPWTQSAQSLYQRMTGSVPGAPRYHAFVPPEASPTGLGLCCLSPELFLRVEGGRVVTRPIKGTRAVSSSTATELARLSLETSEKERAELNMIVDLERNDLGRVCSYGTVRVESPGEIEQFPGLLHRTATISGLLTPGVTFGELLEATFPGGSITGAPKLRAMQLISELETQPRGPYCGAIGWLGFDGDLELNIAIRTAVVDPHAGMAHYFAGAGIVADSDPEAEYDEVLLKAATFFRATGVSAS